MTAHDLSKIPLVESQEHPVCSKCDAPVDRALWHKVRGGPPGNYLIVLSCARCGAPLASLGSGSGHAAIIAVT
jgi:hypothetical protein